MARATSRDGQSPLHTGEGLEFSRIRTRPRSNSDPFAGGSMDDEGDHHVIDSEAWKGTCVSPSRGAAMSPPPPPPLRTPGYHQSSTLSSQSSLEPRATPAPSRDGVDDVEYAMFAALRRRLDEPRRDPRNVFHSKPTLRGYCFVKVALEIRAALQRGSPAENFKFLANAPGRAPFSGAASIHVTLKSSLSRVWSDQRCQSTHSPYETVEER